MHRGKFASILENHRLARNEHLKLFLHQDQQKLKQVQELLDLRLKIDAQITWSDQMNSQDEVNKLDVPLPPTPAAPVLVEDCPEAMNEHQVSEILIPDEDQVEVISTAKTQGTYKNPLLFFF